MSNFQTFPKTLQNKVVFDYKIYRSNVKLKKLKWKDLEIRLTVSMIKAGILEKPDDFSMENVLPKKDVEIAIQLYNYLSQNTEFVEGFENQEYYRDQVVYLAKNNPTNSNFKILGALLGGTDGIITCQMRKKTLELNGEIGEPYRPSLVTDETRDKISELINDYEESNKILTLDVVGDLIEELEAHRPRNDAIKKFLFRVFNLKTITAKQDEKERILLDPERLIKSFFVLNNIIKTKDGTTVLSCLFFNCDEVGVKQDNPNKSQRILVPKSFDGSINIGLNPEGKNTTIISCICADGSIIDPLIVIDRKNYTEFINKYFPHLHITYNDSGFVTSPIFEYWLVQIFVPAVEQKRKENGLSPTEKAVLMLDNAPVHNKNFTNRICQQHNISVFWLLPHSSHVMQPLDVLPFSQFKFKFNGYCKDVKMNYTNKQLKQIVDGKIIQPNSFVPSILEDMNSLQLLFPNIINNTFDKYIKQIKFWCNGISDIDTLNKINDKLNDFDIQEDEDLKQQFEHLSSELINEDDNCKEYIYKKLTTKFNSLINNLKESIQSEIVRSASELIDTNTNNDNPNNNEEIVKNAYGHAITKKLIKCMKALYSSFDSYTIIKAFARCGIDTYNDTSNWRIKIDLSLADRIHENFATIQSYPEYKIIQDQNADKNFICHRYKCIIPTSQMDETLDTNPQIKIITPDNNIVSNHPKPIIKPPVERNPTKIRQLRNTILTVMRQNCSKYRIQMPNEDNIKFYFETGWNRTHFMDPTNFEEFRPENMIEEILEQNSDNNINNINEEHKMNEEEPIQITNETVDENPKMQEESTLPIDRDLDEIINHPFYDDFNPQIMTMFANANRIQMEEINNDPGTTVINNNTNTEINIPQTMNEVYTSTYLSEIPNLQSDAQNTNQTQINNNVTNQESDTKEPNCNIKTIDTGQYDNLNLTFKDFEEIVQSLIALQQIRTKQQITTKKRRNKKHGKKQDNLSDSLPQRSSEKHIKKAARTNEYCNDPKQNLSLIELYKYIKSTKDSKGSDKPIKPPKLLIDLFV